MPNPLQGRRAPAERCVPFETPGCQVTVGCSSHRAHARGCLAPGAPDAPSAPPQPCSGCTGLPAHLPAARVGAEPERQMREEIWGISSCKPGWQKRGGKVRSALIPRTPLQPCAVPRHWVGPCATPKWLQQDFAGMRNKGAGVWAGSHACRKGRWEKPSSSRAGHSGQRASHHPRGAPGRPQSEPHTGVER